MNLLVSFSAWAELAWRYLLEVTKTVNPSSIPGSTLRKIVLTLTLTLTLIEGFPGGAQDLPQEVSHRLRIMHTSPLCRCATHIQSSTIAVGWLGFWLDKLSQCNPAHMGLSSSALGRRGPPLAHLDSRHAYGNTETSDLWAAWAESSGKPVAETMSTWTQVTLTLTSTWPQVS